MHGLEVLLPIVLLLGTGFLVIVFSRLSRISPIVGFLLAGVALGPHGLGVIESNDTTSLLAKLGVVFLLFDIGLHFSMRSMWSLRADIFGLGSLQLFVSGLILGGAVSFAFGVSTEMALLIGISLGLSSTAVVMQMLGDFKLTESPVGQSAKSVIVFQDIAAVFLLILADAVGTETGLGVIVLETLLKTVLAVIAAIALGQLIFSPLMKMMTKYDDPEMFTVLGLLIVMLTGLATAQAGLSLTLGAFLAGMVLAETPFRVLLQTELRPFRSLLLALFFITVGMVVDPVAIWAELTSVLALVLLLVAVKAAVVGALVFITNRPTHQVIQLAFFLAQGSEFAFVVFSMATVKAALGPAITQELIAAVAISMLLSPFMSAFAKRWSLQVCESLDGKILNCPEGENNPVSNQPVFIVGMNEVGKTLARGMKAHKIPYIAVDHDRKRFIEATAAGYIVAYGKTDDLRFWNMLGVSKARAMCITSPRLEVSKRITPVIKKIYPRLSRYAAVNDSAEAVRFAALGMKPFHNHGAPPGLEMTTVILKEFGLDEERVKAWADEEHAAYLDSNNKSVDQEPAETTAPA